MRERGHRRRLGAVIWMIALYGLVLQAFLAGATAPVLAAGGSALCAALDHDGDGAPGPDPHHDHACCLAAPTAALPAPTADVSAVAWPPGASLAFTSPARTRPPATGPPSRPHQPRAPPLA